MLSKKSISWGLAVLFVIAGTGDVLARGGNGGGGNGSGGASGAGGAGIHSSSGVPQGTMVRPEGSQRRDGTFLTTGTTANGAVARPDNGNGLRDGSGLTTTTTVPAATAVATE